MRRIFLDSSVLFSAAYSSRGHSHDLILMAAKGEIIIVISNFVLNETKRNLHASAPEAIPFLEQVFDSISFEYIRPTKRDVIAAANHVTQKDAPIVSAAKKAKVDLLVTLDKKHLLGKPEIAAYAGMDVVTPKEAISLIQSNS